jgi:arabinofuranosyltransferase
MGLRASLWALLPGAALVGAWGLFALAYYGTPVPNTVPAKLPVGVTASWLAAAGVRYLAASAMFDPVGALGVVAAVALIRRQTPEERALVAGSGIYLLRTVQVGGCYMLGRLVSLPVVVAWLVVALVVARRWTPPRPGLALALLVPLHALALLPGRDFPDAAHPAFRGAWMDTRRAEVRLGSWWTWRADPTPPPDHRLVQGAVRPVHVVGPTGAFARALPDGDHVIDAFGLGDPLVARLPGHMQPGVAGHFMRALPDGWVEAWAADDLDRIRDPAVRACAERVWRVSRGPLWTAQRWRTIAGDLLRSGC